jgi:hypothetical protein
MMKRSVLSLRAAHVSALIEGARDVSPVSGLTHNFYRYPARFSPRFVRAAIQAFTERGDLVIDPFMGGGTTLVEALALGRLAVGADISSLAAFVSEVKTTLYSEREFAALERWAGGVHDKINIHLASRPFGGNAGPGRPKHLDGALTWRLRKAIEQALRATRRLESTALEGFARCAILRTAQWALDGRKTFPSIEEFRTSLQGHTLEMVASARELRACVSHLSGGGSASVQCLHRTSAGLETDPRVRHLAAPKLIVTSPPYPGIHVLYHRWQVGGGKETPAPFWIANRLDGSGEAYYTMGYRQAKDLKTYFDNLRSSLQSVVRLCKSDTMIVQVVAFSDPKWQLPAYLAIAKELGLREELLSDLCTHDDGRLWRTVPNRKWYANRRGRTHASNEVVLFHRPMS